MATLYGLNATNRDVSVPSVKIAAGDQYGDFHVAYDEYSLVGVVLANADVINMMKIPAGCRVHNVVLSFPDMGTTGTCTVGWAASADGVESANSNGFLTTVDMNTAANTVHMLDEANIAGMFKSFASEVQVQITMTAASTATSGTIKLAVYYTVC